MEQLNLKFSGRFFALLAMETHAEDRWTIASLAGKILQPFYAVRLSVQGQNLYCYS